MVEKDEVARAKKTSDGVIRKFVSLNLYLIRVQFVAEK
jgi:hypothetical protein